jgi:outer membrane lipoprotein-sorting protein
MRVQAGVGVLIAALLVIGVPGAAAPLPSAAEILRKCLASYDAAKTVQTDVKIGNVTSTGRTWISIQFKAENDANGVIARSSVSVVNTGQGASDQSIQTQKVIDDGTRIYTIYPDQKQYTTNPRASDRVSGLFRSSLANVQRLGDELSVEMRQVNSRPTYVLSSKAPDLSVLLRIDKATFRLQRIHVERSRGATRQVMDLSVFNQLFNQRISPETFEWSPPAGFTETAPGEPDSPDGHGPKSSL